MTFDDFVKLAMRRQGLTNQRAGQALFNTLDRVRPDLSEQLRRGENDPYYDDSKINEFINFVQENWDV